METAKLQDLLQEMTVTEKVAQLVQLTPDFFSEGGEITGPMQEWNLTAEKLYQIGSVLGTHTAEQVYHIQKDYLAHNRLQIPLVFMADVIHGYETIYPIPLALAASFDPETVAEAARLSAKEAAAAGVQVTFSPMADYMKDARWGRVLEGNGEDPVLSEALTRAYVRGYQGAEGELAENKERLAACVKHFIGYGAAEGGRDYNTVDFSDLEMYRNYLPAFRGAVAEGAKLVMTSFNTVRGIPSSANKELIQKILRDELAFDGVLISDWAAVMELIAHRVAADRKEAAQLAFEAGVDMDMMSDCYLTGLEEWLVSEEDLRRLDEAVMRILHLKNDLGLFEDPYRGLTEAGNTEKFDAREVEKSVLETAHKTQVLLKNQENLLPLTPGQKVALIGPKADSQDILGAWSWIGQTKAAVSLAAGLQSKPVEVTLVPFVDGQVLTDAEIAAACQAAENQDVVILAVGETSEEAGEAASLADIRLSRRQQELIQKVSEVNPNIVLVVFSGRPLALTEVAEQAKAILQVWFPGSRGGQAIADVLLGDSAPTGKLPMSFPRSVGQLPLSYRMLSTGRPMTSANSDQKYISRYMDEDNTPLFAFGHGLTYGELIAEKTQLSTAELSETGTLTVSVTLRNPGRRFVTETVQLYIEDLVAEIALPMMELKQWQQVTIAGGASQQLSFTLTEKDLRYVHSDLTMRSDSGEFNVFVGFSSATAKEVGSFRLIK